MYVYVATFIGAYVPIISYYCKCFITGRVQIALYGKKQQKTTENQSNHVKRIYCTQSVTYCRSDVKSNQAHFSYFKVLLLHYISKGRIVLLTSLHVYHRSDY